MVKCPLHWNQTIGREKSVCQDQLGEFYQRVANKENVYLVKLIEKNYVIADRTVA